MRLPEFITLPLANWLISLFESGTLPPHEEGDILAPNGELYMRRAWLVKPTRWTFGCGARIHHTVRSDNDRHLHNHPWSWNVSVILKGVYEEEMPLSDLGAWTWDRGLLAWVEKTVSFWRSPGDVVFRTGATRHRLSIPQEFFGCYSLFIVGPRRNDWGFATGPGRVTPWREYLGLSAGQADHRTTGGTTQ